VHLSVTIPTGEFCFTFLNCVFVSIADDIFFLMMLYLFSLHLTFIFVDAGKTHLNQSIN